MITSPILESIERHFDIEEFEDFLHLVCLRCGTELIFSSLTPHVYLLGECNHHLQARHGFPGAAGGWRGYLDAIPAPQNPT
jgi:hypothetical protein